jgi:hypothetical protein
MVSGTCEKIGFTDFSTTHFQYFTLLITGRLAQGERSPAILVRLVTVHRRASSATFLGLRFVPIENDKRRTSKTGPRHSWWNNHLPAKPATDPFIRGRWRF